MYKIAFISSFFWLSSLFGFQFDYKLTPKQVSDDVWCFFGKLEAPTDENGGNMSNSCYINTGKGYVVVDSGGNYAFASQAYEAMAKNVAKLPVKVVINTHDHDDHWLGNSYYKDEHNARLIGVESITKNNKPGSKTRMFNLLSDDIMKHTKVVPLDKHIKNITTLDVDGKKIMMIPIGFRVHSPDDMFIYMPNEKVLFAGDTIMNGRITSNRDGSVIGQLKAIELIKQRKWDVLIPGHGFDTSKNATKECEMYFTLLKKRILQAVEDEVGADEITSVVTMPEFKDKAMYSLFNKRNVFDAFGELEFYEEE